MKLPKLLAAMLLLTSWQAHGQMVLKAGESYSYQFSTLPFNGNFTFGIAEPSGTLMENIDPPFPLSLGANSYKVELFEDTPAGVPILSRTISSTSRTHDTDYKVPYAWGDLQGSFRITALIGFITVRGFSLQAVTPGNPAGFDVYGTDRIYLLPRPSLSLVRTNGALALRWPASATNFVLESTISLTPSAAWETVTNAVTLNGNTFSVILAPDAPTGHQLFRLRHGP